MTTKTPNDVVKLDDIVKIVKRSAIIMKNGYDSVRHKGYETNIVTSSDIAIQKFLSKELTSLLSGSGFYGEENDECNKKEYTWIVDPIDGTMNYSRGINECCISVGLLYRGEIIKSVVYLPFIDELFTAEKGKGAYFNGKRIYVSNKNFSNSILCTAMSLYNKDYAKQCFDVIEDAYYKCNDVRRFGSCAVELCYIAMGRCDLFFEIRLMPWDYAGSMLVLTEAGGILKGFNEELTFDKPTLLVGANNIENFNKLNEIINTHIKKLPY